MRKGHAQLSADSSTPLLHPLYVCKACSCQETDTKQRGPEMGKSSQPSEIYYQREKYTEGDWLPV